MSSVVFSRISRSAAAALVKGLSVLVAAAIVPAIASAADRGLSTKLGFESAYVSYGTKFAENVVVPMIDAYSGDNYVGVWGYLPLNKDGGGYDFDGEWDFFAGRTFKLSERVSIDLGGTLYEYPGVTVDSNTFEGFFWLNFDTPLQPKVKLYYDFTIKNWIGEFMISRTFNLSTRSSLLVTGRTGFRRPDGMQEWFYATATVDWVYRINDKAQWAIGYRATDNTDKKSVGHGFRGWVGASLAYTW